MSPILFSSKNACCGCSACYSICPKKAIEMRPDELGFLYPAIDQSKCIECGLCAKVCNYKQFKLSGESFTLYAGRNKSLDEVMRSRSGGFFAAVSDWILQKEGVVFGCTARDVDHIYHKCGFDHEDCQEFRKSKYVQSDLRDTFRQCKQALASRKYVLFSGTACQIHGLISFLHTAKIPTDRLITMDIICHGVPSPKIWADYVHHIEAVNNKRIKSVEFRDKSLYGWAAHRESFLFDDGTLYTSDVWTELFYSNTILRESCFACPYTTVYRYSDFTIADYWGIEKNAAEFDDDKGVSLILVRSPKARLLFDEIKSSLDFKETSIESSYQPNMLHPSSPGKKKKKVQKYYIEKGKDKFVKAFLNDRGLFYISIKARKKLKKLFRK